MEDCIFCKIIKGTLPSKKEYEDANVIVIADISPKAPVHVLIIPKKHLGSLIDVREDDKIIMGEMMLKAAQVAKKLGLNPSGYKTVINNGEGAGQIVNHLHMHLLGGWKSPEKGWKV